MSPIKPVAVICGHQVINGNSFFLRTMFHGKIANSVNLINHCAKIYNPASIFVKNCEPQKIKRDRIYRNIEIMSEVATKRIIDRAVKPKTKRTWNEWFSILDEAGAKVLTHKDVTYTKIIIYHLGGVRR
jgi:hypothetical protein